VADLQRTHWDDHHQLFRYLIFSFVPETLTETPDRKLCVNPETSLQMSYFNTFTCLNIFQLPAEFFMKRMGFKNANIYCISINISRRNYKPN